MKSTNKMDGDAFVRSLAGEVCSCKDNHIIIAQEAVDLKDEAKQSAQSYWLMGWTWDEIESVLEDSEYPKNVINYAIKEAKEYARKVLNEGPFSVLKTGQSVKLKNGSIGILLEKYAKHIIVDINDVGKTDITADQLDLAATEKLREAYSLRVKATNMLYKLSTDQLEHVSVESQAINPVLELVDNAVATMASIKQNTDEVKREATQLHTKWEENTTKWQPSSNEEHDFAQYMHVVLTGEKQLDAEVTDLFHNKLGAFIASLHDAIQQGADITNTNIYGFLTDTFPEITNKIEGHLYGIKHRNVKAREYVQQFAKFGKEDAHWKKEAVQWAADSWETTKEFTATWENTLVPNIENGIQIMSEFLMNIDKKQVVASVQKALKTL